MSSQAHMWDLPGWNKDVTVAQLQYGIGIPYEQSWGWFWSDGHQVGEEYVAADPWGMLWIRADTPLIRTALKPGELVGSPACVWLGRNDYVREFLLYLPREKYSALGCVEPDARQRGWYPVAAIRGEAPENARLGLRDPVAR